MADFAASISQEEDNKIEIDPISPSDGVKGAADDQELTVAPPEVEEVPSETLYIQNLNERINIAYMKTTLANLFRHYGKVLDVVAHRNVRMRGQAFVSFANADFARKAMKEVQKFPLYGKPMQISFAKTQSEAVIKALSPKEYEEFHAERLKRKKRSRWDNPVRRKLKLKKQALVTGIQPETAAPGPKKPAVQMPDEYLPPNKILFLQNLPVEVTKDILTNLFSQFENLYEVRMVPTKKDIAFVEYMDEDSATVAKDALHNYKFGEAKIKITFARK